MNPLQVPILIVGGGGAGLTASMLLAQLRVETLLVSALPTPSVLPKAHVLNQRAMEILGDVGVAEEVYAHGTPAENMRHTAYYAGLAGPDPAYGSEIARLESWGAGGLDPDWTSASPCRQANLPQIRLEPILRTRAEALAPGRVRFHHELVDLAQDADGVTAEVRDKDARDRYLVRARYLLACDGGRTVGPRLGVKLERPRDLLPIVSVYMSADLSRWARDPDVLIRWLWLPERGALATLVGQDALHRQAAHDVHLRVEVGDAERGLHVGDDARVVERAGVRVLVVQVEDPLLGARAPLARSHRPDASGSVACSWSATPPIGIRRRVGSVSPAASPTPKTCAGSSRPCSRAARAIACSTRTRPSAARATRATCGARSRTA
jgi:2-polyprenyl-6-methoxyphenol hydroxylase-like FAD-dependent oxidoreductase